MTLLTADQVDQILIVKDSIPYGAYIRADGSQVLFERSYDPMLQRDADGTNCRPASGWIEHVTARFFYDDHDSPRRLKFGGLDERSSARSKLAYYRSASALVAFEAGLPITPYFIAGEV